MRNCQSDWVVTGSLGMALQGMNIEIHDIAIQTDQHGVDDIESLFSEYIVRTVRYPASERIRCYFGSLKLIMALLKS